MKKIFAFMKTALVAAVGLSLFSCSVDGNKDDIAAKDCGSIKLSIAIPKFMTPDADTSARMVMPSTKVIRLEIYENADSEKIIYFKEFSVANSGLSYEDYNYITAELDDVPIGTYEAKSMYIQLFDGKGTNLTHGLNNDEVEVTAETGEDAATVTFYTLPDTDMSIELDEDGWNVNSAGTPTNITVTKTFYSLNQEDLDNCDIYFLPYKVTIPYGYGLDVSLKAKKESSDTKVAIAIYDSLGVMPDEDGVKVLTNTIFDNTKFISTGTLMDLSDEGDEIDAVRYIVLYSEGLLEALTGDEAELVFTLTEED
ncbi:MAG: hypothetical protein K6B43_12650 [Treponema sp.]|nr:hypothetical protein [Treponema sp.]